jgi:GTP diphosphokinase / guanosine-3',5'-bis(diphosphate) 3'-diphosphatase
VAEKLNYADLNALKAAIGENHVSAKSVAERIKKLLQDADPAREEQLPVTAREPRTRARRTQPVNRGVHVEGLDDVMVRLSRCCTPVPGDEIMGFVTRGRGVSVHRSDCANAMSLSAGQGDRLIDVEWDNEGGGTFVASIEVKALDRAKLLRDVSVVLADHHVNIISCNSMTGSDRISKMRFDFELADPSHLDAVLDTVKQIDSIYDAYRVLPGKGG